MQQPQNHCVSEIVSFHHAFTTTVQLSKEVCMKTVHILALETLPSNWQSSSLNRGREQSRSHFNTILTLQTLYHWPEFDKRFGHGLRSY